MAIIRTVHFKADPGHAEEMIARRAALISAVRAAYNGLTEARLARAGEDTWVDMWRWDSPASMQAALAGAPALPEAAAAFSLTRDLTAEEAELVDER
jgi:quinol monooxygenase YgiN